MQKLGRGEKRIMSDPFQKACAIIEQHTKIEIAERELAQAEEVLKQKKDNLYNHKAKLWELENEQ
jgi:hypothetical protein